VAYPLAQMPRFAEFRERLALEFGCTYEQLPDSLVVNDGEPQAVHYLKRVINGVTLTYAVFIGDDERVRPSIIRSACARLQIDPAAFGLTLG
jgi:hypothetical protein